MQREKVEFAVNIPTQVIIDGAGVEQPNRDGVPEWRYVLQGGDRIMWVPQSVHQTMQDFGGNNFTICKVKTGRAAATWEVTSHAPTFPPRQQNGNGYSATSQPAHTMPGRRPQPQTAPAMQQRGELECTAADRLAGAFAAAVDVALEAETYAKRKGISIQFQAADIRAMAATLYIEQSKAGRA